MPSLRTTRSLLVVVAAALAATAGIFGLSLTDAGSATSAVEAASSDVLLAAMTEPSIVCDVESAVYGDEVSCSAIGGTTLEWPDGERTGLDATHVPLAVGDLAVAVLDSGGLEVATTSLAISPDVAVTCQARNGDSKKVFQLAKSKTRSEGWDYVFRDVASGDQIAPGDPGHPNGGAEDGLERIVLSEEQSTGLCRLTSRAGEDHDGEYQLSIESPWEATQTTPMRIIGPSSKTQWAGTQPAEVEGVVIVNGLTASERVGVYQSGCS